MVNTLTQENIMFTQDFIIDSIQSAKKQVVNTFVVNNESFKKELIKLIDAQTEFAKGQTKTTLAIAEAFYKNASDAFYTTAKASK
jgi:hypothetical protein